MKFLIEVITTGFKFSSPKCGAEQLKMWSGGRKGSWRHMWCLSKTSVNQEGALRGFPVLQDGWSSLPHSPSVDCKEAVAFQTPGRHLCPLFDTVFLWSCNPHFAARRNLFLRIMRSLIAAGACLCCGTQARSSQSVHVSSATEGFISRVLSNIIFWILKCPSYWALQALQRWSVWFSLPDAAVLTTY